MASASTHTGFAPVYNSDSQALILGSFPSVKSREISFYYGNKQNRFWRMLCGYFNENVPETTEEKCAFLLRRKIALWDMVTQCDIVGSSDTSVKNATVADLQTVLRGANIRKILLNGALAWKLFEERYPQLLPMGIKLPSTSSANPRYDESAWRRALDAVFIVR